jgi:putative transposase
MIETVQAVRIQAIKPGKAMSARIRLAQLEAGKAWTLCRDQLKIAMTGPRAQASAFTPGLARAGDLSPVPCSPIRPQAPAFMPGSGLTNRTAWPTRASLQLAVKGQFGLHSQSAQMITHAFLANVDTARQLRKAGRSEIRYPYKDKLFYPLYWPAQAMAIHGDKIILPMGRSRPSIVLDRPDWLDMPAACKLIWNRIGYELHISTDKAVALNHGTAEATVDLGQIHQCAVTTSTGQGLIVSGRGIRAEKQLMNKMHGSIAALQSRCTKGSRRWKKLQRARNGYALRSERRVRDLRHKGTRQVIDFCVTHGVGDLFIGDPHGVRKHPCGRRHNQRMSQWEYGKDTDYLQQKAAQASISSFTGSERGTSSRCPKCGHRHKPTGRNWSCKACGFTGHRDLVGSANMHEIAFGHKTIFPAAKAITYLRPGTAIQRVLAGRQQRQVSRSNRPGTGHVQHAGHVAAQKHSPSTTGILRAPSGAGQGFAFLSEAHSL